MSTRCQIAIYEKDDSEVKDFTALIYRHSDGYPEAVWKEIIDIVSRFINIRGYDAEYLAARLLQHLCNNYDKDMIDIRKEMKSLETADIEVLGYGICNDFHWDIEYLYKIFPKEIQCLKVNGDDIGSGEIIKRKNIKKGK